MRMKKIFATAVAILMILVGALSASAASLAWTYTDSSNLTGWVCYYQATSDTSKTYSYTLNDPAARTMDISVLQLIPGTEYNIWLTAYNANAESGPSNTVDFTMPAFTPPDDSHPVTITIEAPATVTITQP